MDAAPESNRTCDSCLTTVRRLPDTSPSSAVSKMLSWLQDPRRGIRIRLDMQRCHASSSLSNVTLVAFRLRSTSLKCAP